jgi:hypothetical protein
VKQPPYWQIPPHADREADGGKLTPAEKKQVNNDDREERDFERRGGTPIGVP